MAWARHLAKRSGPADPWQRVSGKIPPVAWVLPEGGKVCAALVARLGRGARAKVHGDDDWPNEAADWLSKVASAWPTPAGALEAVAWAHALPALARRVPCELWWDLLGHLVGSARAAGEEPLEDKPLAHQLLAGELGLTLAYRFPEIVPCRKLAKPARQALSAGLVELLDGEGLPHARYLPATYLLLACWTRCRLLGELSPKDCWSKDAEQQYRWLVRQAMRLARADGSLAFSADAAGAWSAELFEAALELGGDAVDWKIAPLALPRWKATKTTRRTPSRLPDASVESEWAETAVLRNNWSRNSERAAVVYAGGEVCVELSVGRETIASGLWSFEIRRDGRILEPDSEWEQVCWLSDDDVSYLELEIKLDGGLTVQRHLMLARDDRLLLAADSVLGTGPARIDYRGCLPLSPEIAFQGSDEHWEGYLAGRKRRALVLPVGLPEWRSDGGTGSLEPTEGGLELRQQADGGSLFAPLVLDLDPGRLTRRRTWRRLTVAEDRRVVPAEVAVGYRVAVGRDQWLIYRSLGKWGNRTLLGHNLSMEMLVARFFRDGEVVPLIEIE